LIIRIGTGEGNHPWNDNWLPRDHLLRPLACLPQVQLDAKIPSVVASFVDPMSATWNTQALQHGSYRWT
jgi:hypothetical protein